MSDWWSSIKVSTLKFWEIVASKNYRGLYIIIYYNSLFFRSRLQNENCSSFWQNGQHLSICWGPGNQRRLILPYPAPPPPEEFLQNDIKNCSVYFTKWRKHIHFRDQQIKFWIGKQPLFVLLIVRITYKNLYGQVAEFSNFRECVKISWNELLKNEILHRIEDEGDNLY